MRKEHSSRNGWSGEERLVVAGLLGASFVSVLALLTVQEPGPAARLSIVCFAICIPLHCLAIWWYTEHSAKLVNIAPGAYTLAFFGGSLLAFIGLVSLFWHISWLSGTLFLLASVGAIALGTYLNFKAAEMPEESEDQQPHGETPSDSAPGAESKASHA